jgi:tetratricopeptide (TPR) repeat protein
MKRTLSVVAVCLSVGAMAGTVSAQIGKTVAVSAGTDEDKALSAIYAAPDGPDKLAMIDKFMTDYGKGDFELLGDQLYMQTYLAQKNYPKVFEYGDKVLALDPQDLAAASAMARAAIETNDTDKLYSAGEKVPAIIGGYKAKPAPEGTSVDQWKATQQTALANAQGDISYIQYSMIQAAYKTTDNAARAALFQRYVAAFPDSPYSGTARDQIAISYQQAQNAPKMVESAQKALEADPNDVSMLILLCDAWSDDKQQLDKAAADAQKALDVLQQAKKPDGVSDDDWQKQVALEKGIAYTSLGEVDVNKGRNAAAIDAFKQAKPLLKANDYYYGENLYRLGFTLAKMQRLPEARVVLTEAVSVNSPYKTRAKETLDKISGAHARS